MTTNAAAFLNAMTAALTLIGAWFLARGLFWRDLRSIRNREELLAAAGGTDETRRGGFLRMRIFAEGDQADVRAGIFVIFGAWTIQAMGSFAHAGGAERGITLLGWVGGVRSGISRPGVLQIHSTPARESYWAQRGWRKRAAAYESNTPRTLTPLVRHFTACQTSRFGVKTLPPCFR